MDALSQIAPGAAVVMVVLGLFGYFVALMVAVFFSSRQESLGSDLRQWFMSSPAQHIGIPCSAIAAFAIVAVLLKAFPPAMDSGGELVLNAFGLEFSGPSGPITLWLMCFLGFVFSLKLLRS